MSKSVVDRLRSEAEIAGRPGQRDRLLALAHELAALLADLDAAREALRRVEQERDALKAKLDKPCGECHPCMNWPAETWRRAGRHLPDVHRFGEMEDERRAMRPVVEAARAYRHQEPGRMTGSHALFAAVDTYETQEGTGA